MIPSDSGIWKLGNSHLSTLREKLGHIFLQRLIVAGHRGAYYLRTGWWFQIFFYFHPYLGKWSNLTNIFQMGWNHQPENEWSLLSTERRKDLGNLISKTCWWRIKRISQLGEHLWSLITRPWKRMGLEHDPFLVGITTCLAYIQNDSLETVCSTLLPVSCISL